MKQIAPSDQMRLGEISRRAVRRSSAVAINGEAYNWANPVMLGELFCGAGGMALGASLAGFKGWCFEHAWVTDIDRDSCRTIEQVVASDRIYQRDIKQIDFDELEPIDGLVFGFPCNDFSIVGKRKGIDGNYGGLYRFGAEALATLQPKFFVAENVSGLSSINKKADFSHILNEFEQAGTGYKVTKHLYRFEDYGVPQKRHRYIIVGFRSDLDIDFAHPAPTGKTNTAKMALTGIPWDCSNNERTAQSARVVERLKYIKPGENVFTADIPERLRLNMRSKALISQIYRRLLPDEPSYTVTGSGGGGTHLYHWREDRALTNRERARLQTFPDDYVFEGGKESVRRQIGMAVPPQGIAIVFESILETIANKVDINYTRRHSRGNFGIKLGSTRRPRPQSSLHTCTL